MTEINIPVIELFSAGLGRWHYAIIFKNGRILRSSKPIFRYYKARSQADKTAKEIMLW